MALDEQSRMWVIRSKRERERIRCPPDAPERSAAWNRGDAPSQAEVGLAVSPFNSVGLAPALGGMGRNRRNRRRSSHLAADDTTPGTLVSIGICSVFAIPQ
jgi:hypothetical protein